MTRAEDTPCPEWDIDEQWVKAAGVKALERRVKWLEEGLVYIKQFWTPQVDVKSGIENAHAMNLKVRKWLATEPRKE